MKKLTVTINLTDELYAVLEKLGKKKSLLTPNETTELDEVVENFINIGMLMHENYTDKKYPTAKEESYHHHALRLYLPHFSRAIGFKIPFNEFVALAAHISREVLFDLLELESDGLKNHGWWTSWFENRQEDYFDIGEREYYPLEPKVEDSGTFISSDQKRPGQVSSPDDTGINDPDNTSDSNHDEKDNSNN